MHASDRQATARLVKTINKNNDESSGDRSADEGVFSDSVSDTQGQGSEPQPDSAVDHNAAGWAQDLSVSSITHHIHLPASVHSLLIALASRQ